MGRHAGFIGLSAAVASASDQVLVPELTADSGIDLDNIIKHVKVARSKRGNASYIIVVTENLWPGGVSNLADTLAKQTGLECRPVILGHVQRGGSPVTQDRLLATKLGAHAVEAALAGKSMVMIGEHNQKLVTPPLQECWQKRKELDPYLVKIQQEFFDVLN
jgi:6-phosphofructokinase 1